MTDPAERRAPPWWKDRLLLAAAAVFGLWAVIALGWPLSGDAGVFAWMADTAHRGGAPYAEAFDTKGPAAWLPSLLMQVLVGRTEWGIRAFDIAMVVAAVAALRGVARRLGLPGHGRIAIVLYLLWYAGLDYWQSAQPDGWVATWLIVACWLALSGGGIGAIAAGALIGCATMSKPFYLGFIAVVAGMAWTAGDATLRARVTRVVLSVLGLIVSIGGLLLFLRSRDALDAFFEVQRWNADVYAGFEESWLTRIPTMFKGMLVVPWGIVAPLAFFGASSPTRAHRWITAMLALGFAGAVAGVMLQGKGWQYHWLPMLPFLALLADIGFAALQQETAGAIAGRFRWFALVLAVAVALTTPMQQIYRWVRTRTSAEARERYEQHEFQVYGRQGGSVRRIVDSLVAGTPDTARILIWAMVPGPHFLHGLPTLSRYALIRPLYDGEGSAYRARYRTHFEAEMRAAPPRWWLVPTPALLARDEKLRDYRLALYPAAASLVERDYHLAGQSAEWMIYERNVPAATR